MRESFRETREEPQVRNASAGFDSFSRERESLARESTNSSTWHYYVDKKKKKERKEIAQVQGWTIVPSEMPNLSGTFIVKVKKNSEERKEKRKKKKKKRKKPTKKKSRKKKKKNNEEWRKMDVFRKGDVWRLKIATMRTRT